MKRLMFALLGLLLAGPVTAATEASDGQQWLYGPTGAPLMLDNSDVARSLTGTSDGYANVNVRGVGEWQETGIALTDITTLAYVTATPVNAADFSHAFVAISYAASDSDSVALQVYVVGKMGLDSGDGLDYFFDSNTADTSIGPWLVCTTAQTGRRIGSQQVVTIPANSIPGRADPNTVGFWLPTDARFEYLGFIVYNPTTVQIDDVTLSVWLKGN